MKEQELKLKKINSFNLKDIFECGQCFRWNENEDGSYTGVVKNNVIKISQNNNNIIVRSYGEDNIEELFNFYFDMNTDYEKIKNKLRKIDSYMSESIKYGEGSPLCNFFLHILLLSKTLLNS